MTATAVSNVTALGQQRTHHASSYLAAICVLGVLAHCAQAMRLERGSMHSGRQWRSTIGTVLR